MRVAGFFCGRGDGVESNEGEEHDGRSAHHARETARHKWMPIRRMHQEGTEGDDENDYRYLGHNDPGVSLGALANSVAKQNCYCCDNYERRQLERDRMACDDRQRCR